MKNFIINVKLKHTFKTVFIILFWLLVWQLAYLAISEEILLVSPFSVFKALLNLINTIEFWSSISFSFSRIISGFLMAVITGSILASISYKFKVIKEILTPLITVIKAIPVASFVILCLVWIDSKNLSVFISFLMVVPIIYINVLEGFNSIDVKLLEMIKVFKVTSFKRLTFLYIPKIAPFFISACSLSLGLCWKSGVAAEVIGLPNGSVGEKLYEAKIYLNMNELFAWTLVIVIISFIFEKLFLYLIKCLKASN